MTHKAASRVFETSSTTGTGTYTVDGAQTGFQSFVSGIGANNFCTYVATDDTNWEVCIGQVLSGPNRITRDSVIASSNANAAVNWGAGTRKLRCMMAGEMAMPRVLSLSVAGAAGTTVLTQDQQRRDMLIFTGALTGNRVIEVDATPANYTVLNQTSGNFTLTFRVTGQTGAEFFQGRASRAICEGVDIWKLGDDTPPGMMEDYAGGTVPTGYLQCDGSNVSRTTYSALFNKVGTTHGAGDGSTTFGLPDMRRRTSVGSGGTGTGTLGNAVGNTGGEEAHALASGELAVHAHTQQGTFTSGNMSLDHTHNTAYGINDGGPGTVAGPGTVTYGSNVATSAGSSVGHTHDTTISGATANNGSGTAHNNLPPSLVVLKVIRT
jgi:microcystin-dependent protein